ASGTRAFGADAPAVHRDQRADDRQAEPEAAVRSRRRAVALAKALEDVQEEVRWNALSRVVDADACDPVVLLETDVDAATGRRVLDGVRQEIREHLPQPRDVAGHLSQGGIDRRGEPDTLRFGGRTDRCEDGCERRREVDVAPLELERSADDPRDVEEILDQTRLAERVPLDRRDRLRPRLTVD